MQVMLAHPHKMPGRVARERKGGIAPCLSLAPIFTPRCKWPEAFLGPVAPASHKSGFQPAASPLAAPQPKCLHLPGWDHCIQQLGCAAFSSIPVIRAVSLEWGQKHFSIPSRVLVALRHNPFTSSGYFALGGFLKIVFTVLTPLRDCTGKQNQRSCTELVHVMEFKK